MKQSLGTLATAYLGKLSYVSETISTALGILVFVLLQLLHFISLFAGYVIVVCLIVIIVCIRYWEKEKITHWIVPCAFVLLLLSAWETNKSIVNLSRETEKELIADATESAIDGYYSYDPDEKEWLDRAILENKLIYILVPATQDFESILLRVYDKSLVDKDSEGNYLYRIVFSRAQLQGENVDSKYYLLALYQPFMRNENVICDYKVLPESVSLTMRGVVSQSKGEFSKAKAYFSKADSLSNSASTALLSKWLSSGYGEDPDKKEALRKMYQAADNGSRYARLTLGAEILSDAESNDFQKAQAEGYLRKAAVLRSVASNNTAKESEDATRFLSSYYRTTNRFYDAYQLSKTSYSCITNPNLKYGIHLDNCLSMGYYEEAQRLIEEGEKLRFPNCYLAHAELYIQGKVVKRDIQAAEKLLRFAADSLGEYVAYNRLASIYQALGDNRSAQLWKRMFIANYHTSIDDE